MTHHNDVVIVGAGIVGSAIAREIARYEMKVVVLEKGTDVAVGTSKANSGIVHAGYSEKPGTKKARFAVEGQKRFDHLAEELDFSFKRIGSMVICFDEEGKQTLDKLKQQGEENGLKGLKILDYQEAKLREPNLGKNVYAVLDVPMGGIVSPYGMTIAYAENAADNGVEFRFDYEVSQVNKEEDGFFSISSEDVENEDLRSRVLINAAGLHSDDINNMLSKQRIETKPRLGEYVLLDTTESGLVKHTIFQLPTKMGKGVLVTPTVGGNILIGPTTIEKETKDDFSATREGLMHVIEKSTLSIENIKKDKIITSFAGLRAHTELNDFIVEEAVDVPRLINLCGIESPGLTAAPAIAKEVERLVISILNPEEKINFNPKRKSAPKFKKLTNEERHVLIAQNNDYGKVICRCEWVTKGEIIKALQSPLPINNMDAIKRRTRLGMGRCQGGFCHMKIVNIIAEELGIDLKLITKNGKNSNLLMEENKTNF